MKLLFYSGQIYFVNSSQIYSNVDDLNQGQDGAACDRKGPGHPAHGIGKAKRYKVSLILSKNMTLKD